MSKSKVYGYLLNPVHVRGFSKANFFNRFGFRRNQWKLLQEALLRHGGSHLVASMNTTPFGQQFAIEGKLICPDGRTPQIRVVWQIDIGQVVPRLVTAYPIGTNL